MTIQAGNKIANMTGGLFITAPAIRAGNKIANMTGGLFFTILEACLGNPNTETSQYIMNNIRNKIELSIPIQFDNMDFDPPNGIWARLAIRLGTSQRIGIVGRYRVHGVLFVQLFDLIEQGVRSTYSQAEVVKAIFDTKVICRMKFRTTKIEFVGETEKWYQTNVSTPFTLDLPI